MQKIPVIAIAAVASLVGAAAARAECPTRHFYNKSNVDWNVALAHGTCDQPSKNGLSKCVAKPGESLDIHYTNHDSQDRLSIWSDVYWVQGFNVDAERCDIDHDGSTGNLALNEPAKGDITTCGGPQWTCAPRPPRPRNAAR